jgi:hypothetical protein
MSVTGKKFKFDQEGVEVTVPQPAGKKIGVRRQAMPKPSDMPGKPGGFQPGRLVGNFELFDEAAPERFLIRLDEPFEMRIRYTPGDLKRAEKANKSLQLGFWDGSEWVTFTAAKHQFRLEPDADDPKKGGVGVVVISRWGDPPIAWTP